MAVATMFKVRLDAVETVLKDIPFTYSGVISFFLGGATSVKPV